MNFAAKFGIASRLGVLLAVVGVIVLLGEETRGRTLEDISS